MRIKWVLGCALASVLINACGYLDEDITLTDEQFAQSFAGESADYGSGRGVGEGMHWYAHGCGVHGYGYSGGYGRYGDRARVETDAHTSVINMGATTISASDPGGAQRWVVRHPSEDSPPYYRAGRLKTWGDYLEAEMERARRNRR